MNLYQTNPDLERYSDWSASWKTRRFKDIAAGMGYQVNPGRTGNRWQQKVNGERHQLPRWVLRRLGLSRFPLLAVLSMGVLGGEVKQV